MLCSTGFFENIGQWYCTPIGNISDEGKGSDLSKTQQDTADSLMSKLMSDEQLSSSESEKKMEAGKEDATKP